MPERIPNGVAKDVVFRAIASSDHFTPKTGVVPVITIWETGDGAAFKNPAAGATTATEIASGFYKFTLGATDVNVAGPMAWRAAVANMDDVGDVYEVVNVTNAGFTALPNVASGSAGAVIISGTGTSALSVTAGAVNTLTTYTGDTPQTGDSFARIGVNGAGLPNIDLPNQTMDITGSLSGSVGSVTGAVGSVTGAVGSVTGAVGSVTGAVGSVAGNVVGTVAGVTPSTAAQVAAVLTTALADAYAANGVAPTLQQAIMAMHQMLMDFAISSTSYTVKKLDNTATAFVVTLDSATTPTAAART